MGAIKNFHVHVAAGSEILSPDDDDNMLHYTVTHPHDPTDVTMSKVCSTLEVGEFGKVRIKRSKKNVYRIGDLKNIYCTLAEPSGTLVVRVGGEHLPFTEFMRHLNIAA